MSEITPPLPLHALHSVKFVLVIEKDGEEEEEEEENVASITVPFLCVRER